jgi:DNA modification methylase
MTFHKLYLGKSHLQISMDRIDSEPGPFPFDDWVDDNGSFKPINCFLADPPYGVSFRSTYGKNPEALAKYNQEIDDDQDVETAIAGFDMSLKAALPWMAAECEIYIFSQWQVAPQWQLYFETLAPLGIELRQLIIWEKGYPGIGDVKYNWGCGHEFIYYLKMGKRPVPYRRSGILHIDADREPLPSVIAVDKVRPGTNRHPTQKPIELLKILIEYSTIPGDFVYDPYAGSGSTLLAAKQLGRNCAGFEVKRSYFDDAQKALSEFSMFDFA